MSCGTMLGKAMFRRHKHPSHHESSRARSFLVAWGASRKGPPLLLRNKDLQLVLVGGESLGTFSKGKLPGRGTHRLAGWGRDSCGAEAALSGASSWRALVRSAKKLLAAPGVRGSWVSLECSLFEDQTRILPRSEFGLLL